MYSINANLDNGETIKINLVNGIHESMTKDVIDPFLHMLVNNMMETYLNDPEAEILVVQNSKSVVVFQNWAPGTIIGGIKHISIWVRYCDYLHSRTDGGHSNVISLLNNENTSPLILECL